MRNYSSRAFYHIISNPDILNISHDIIKDILNTYPEIMYYMIYDTVDSDGLKDSTVVYTYTIDSKKEFNIFPFIYAFFPTRDSIYHMEKIMKCVVEKRVVKRHFDKELFFIEKGGWLTTLTPYTEYDNC